MALNTNALYLDNNISEQMLKILHYFADDTIAKIFDNIDRMEVSDTGKLKNSIYATVRYNAGGNDAIVSFFYAYYARFVEDALGKYYGVDADLGKGVGVKAKNIDIPAISKPNWGPMTANDFPGLPKSDVRKLKHLPRPFFMAEIRRGVHKVTDRLARTLAFTADAHLMHGMCDLFDPTGESWKAVLSQLGYKEHQLQQG